MTTIINYMGKYRFVLLPILSGLIIVLVTVFFALPKIRTIASLKDQLGNEKEKLSRLTEKSALLEGFDQHELDKKVTIVETALPSKKAVAEILVTLSSLSIDSGVTLVGFSISPGILVPEEPGELVFQSTFEGPRENLKNFLTKAGKVLPIIKVISLGIEQESATLKLESYYTPLPKTIGTIDTPLAKISESEEKIYQTIAQFESFERKLPKVPTGKDDPFSSL